MAGLSSLFAQHQRLLENYLLSLRSLTQRYDVSDAAIQSAAKLPPTAQEILDAIIWLSQAVAAPEREAAYIGIRPRFPAKIKSAQL